LPPGVDRVPARQREHFPSCPADANFGWPNPPGADMRDRSGPGAQNNDGLSGMKVGEVCRNTASEPEDPAPHSAMSVSTPTERFGPDV